MQKNRIDILQPSSRPATPGKPNPNCPILLDARVILEKSRDLQRSIRRLKRSTQRCLTCPECAECPTLCIMNDAVEDGIYMILREWGLDQL